MKRWFAVCAALVGGLMLVLSPSAAWAACTVPTEPLQHLEGGWFTHCPDAFPVSAFAYALSGATTTNAQATINSGSVDIVCEANTGTNGQAAPCQVEAGTAGDGNITVLFDWSGGGNFVGCPNATAQPNLGRNMLQIVANDGSSLLVSIGFSFDLGGYIVDFAQVLNTTSFVPIPLSCNTSDAGLQITQQTATPTAYTVNVTVPAAHMHSDCDPGVLGNVGNPLGFTPTCDATIPPTLPGKLYTTTFTCGQSPDSRLTGGTQTWTATAVQPDANGNAVGVTIQRPTITGQCAFLAASGNVSGTETLSVMGAVEVQGQGAPSPKALNVSASRSGGNVVVSFRTDSEIELAGFNILADAQGGKNRIQVNSQMIAPKGVSGAGASYTVSIPQGSLKGAKTIYVESVTTSGAKILSDPARL